ncbi:hypothetical protein FRC02_006825, partial [Tulasnella sp. 418]
MIESLLEFPKYASLSSLSALTLHFIPHLGQDGDYASVPATMFAKDFFNFLRGFSGISHLELRGICHLASLGEDEVYTVPPIFRLYELRYEPYYDHVWPIPVPNYSKILQWLMGGATASYHLRIFEVTSLRPDEVEPVSRFLKAHGSSLTSLSINCSTEELSKIGLSDICSGLRALRLPQSFIFGELRDSLKLPNLEYLEFGDCEDLYKWEEDTEAEGIPEVDATVGMGYMASQNSLGTVLGGKRRVRILFYFDEQWEPCRQKGMNATILHNGYPDE